MPPTNKRPGDDIEGSARKKSGSSSRTGQACDRCKIRKIRCDARPGGCSPCIQNNTECKTTDRITGRATTRGAVEQLENENTSLKMYMLELQQQLRENGLEPKAPTSVPPDYMPSQSNWGEEDQQPGSWGNLSTGDGYIPVSARSEEKVSHASLLPDFRPGCIGDNYLGVSSGNNWLSPIEGTSLALFGMRIDVAEFLPPESDPMAAPMSYRTFLAHALGKAQPTTPPDFPPYEEFKQYADWYFKTVQIFVPVLHRPDFMKLLAAVFKGQHRPTTPETVMLHMVLAIMKFVFYCRNRTDQLRSESMSHYLFAVSKILDLVTGHSLADMQALVLICSQLRNQPRPGAAWMFTNAVFGIAVEIGLHRSANNWQGSASDRDPHTVEMRKRIFWTILLLHVSIGGKLGRPMPIRLEDFDIEIPEAQPDNMPGETNLSKWQKCSFRAAIQGFKALKIIMQAYSTVYSIRSGPEPYDLSVQNISRQIDNLLEQLPPGLSGGPETVEEDRSPALYLQFYAQHTRLLLHHPSLCRSSSPHMMATNLDVCLDASNKLLASAVQLKAVKALDTTWMQTTDFLAAIFTSLFIHTQRQDQMGSSDLQQLRQDMESWLDVMDESGRLLGAGSKLRDAVKHIVDTSLSNISRHLAAKTASAGLATTGAPDVPTDESAQQQVYSHANGLSSNYTNGHGNNDMSRMSQQTLSPEDRSVDQHHQSYPSNTQIYSEAHPQGLPAYPSANMTSFNSSPFNTNGAGGGDMKPNLQQQTSLNPNHAVLTPQPTTHHNTQILPQQSYLQSFQPQQNGYHPAAGPSSMDMLHAGPMAWRHFTDNMITNMGAPDYMSHANANFLMTMRDDKQHHHQGVDMSGAPAAGGVNGMGMLHGNLAADAQAQAQWGGMMGYGSAPAHPQGNGQ